jgi:class 3 adenylate cyclase/DNA-binding CsgD family transcriptional regulator
MSVRQALPTGTVTVLFTDIEGSTRLLKGLGERYGELLADHHRLLREAFAAHGGYEMGTAGDAFFVAFARARDALAAAVAGQRALDGWTWPDGLECRVRMGLHTGEPELGPDGYHGIVMHRGARIADAGHGGQILLSSVTAELVRDDLPPGTTLVSLGEQQLKDIDHTERLYQLVADGLRAEFPPPRAKAAKAPAKPRRQGPALVGRTEECLRLDRLLDDARISRSGSLVIRGEAGVGKSSLLAYATDRAEGFVVLRATGFESEAELAFSGLLQLCRPVLDQLDELPDHQARALRSALGLGPAEETDRLSIFIATLGLLAHAAEKDDLLVAVDDAQWLDSTSSDAILFAARRFEADRVAVVLTVRDDDGDFHAPGLDELRLRGLDAVASRELLAAHSAGDTDPSVAARLHELTSGNPLALVELPRMLSPEQLKGDEQIEQPLNLGTRVERAFTRRVEALSPGAQQALLIAAASESDRLDTILAALRGVGVDASALHEAEDAGLISQVAEALVFRHPLVRSAVYHAATPSERRAAHTALANALSDPRDVERRAWQLASAAFGPDEEVASALEQAAVAARERSGYSGASAAYERAARLTPDEDMRLRRLHAAADNAWSAGQTARAIALLEEALAECRDSVTRGHLLNLRGHIERHAARAENAYVMLIEAADLLQDAAPVEAAGARMGAYRSTVLMQDGALGREVAEEAYERANMDGGPQEFFANLALGVSLGGGDERGRTLLERAESLVEAKGSEIFEQQPRYLSLAGMGCEYLRQYERGLATTTWAVNWAKERGNYGALPVALYRKGGFENALGLWSAAYATTSESVEVATEQGTHHFRRSSLMSLALFDAYRGEETACRAHIDEALALSPLLGRAVGASTNDAAMSRLALLDLSLGRLEAAAERFEEIVLGRESGEPRNRRYIPNLVEVYVRLGRDEDARPLINAYADFAERHPLDDDPAMLERLRGLLEADDGFERHFESALELHASRASRFEEARTRLCYGERLRRARRRRDAREQLRPALETFERLGAPPWAERARAELRATGERLRARGAEHEELTAQELRIALQAAEGKTNRQIGAAMFLSPKTVEFHLGRAYRKLGISSRAELIRHFASGTAAEPSRK